MGMYGSRAVTLLVLISDDVINRIPKLDIQTNILIYVTRCCTDLTTKVLKERTFGQSSALLLVSHLNKSTLCESDKRTRKRHIQKRLEGQLISDSGPSPCISKWSDGGNYRVPEARKDGEH